MAFFTYHYYSAWGYILVSQKEKEALIKNHKRQPLLWKGRGVCALTQVSCWQKLVFRGYKYSCGSRDQAPRPTLDGRGGV